MNKEDYESYSTKETARLLGLKHHHTLAVWRSEGSHPTLKWTKIGRIVRYYKKYVDKFIEENTFGE